MASRSLALLVSVLIAVSSNWATLSNSSINVCAMMMASKNRLLTAARRANPECAGEFSAASGSVLFSGCSSGIPYRSLELVNSGRPRLTRLVIAGSRVVCLPDLVAALRPLDCVACRLGRSPVAPTLLEELLSVGIGGGAGLQSVVQDIALALSARARRLHELHGLLDLRLQRRGLRLFLLLPPGGLRLFLL